MKFFSRTRDEITESFPELPDALAGLPQDAILDGEIVAWEYPPNPAQTQEVVDETFSQEAETKAGALGRALPFSMLQQRLGRKKVSERMLREIPVAYLVFDVLYAGGELLIDRPLLARARILDELLGKENFKHREHRGAQRESNLCLLLPCSESLLRCTEAGFEILYFGIQAFGKMIAEADEVVFDQRDFG